MINIRNESKKSYNNKYKHHNLGFDTHNMSMREKRRYNKKHFKESVALKTKSEPQIYWCCVGELFVIIIILCILIIF